MVTLPAPESREPEVVRDNSSPAALPVEPGASRGPGPTARPPAPAGAAGPSVVGRPVEVHQGYLAPALRAAAAARARTAQICAATSVAAADAAHPSPREWLVPVPEAAAATAPGPAALSLPPMSTEYSKMVEMTAAWTRAHGLSVAGANGSPAGWPRLAVAANPGLSVAEAARVSRIAFRPVRPDASPRPAAPAEDRQPPALPSIATPTGEATTAGQATVSPAPAATDAAPTRPMTRPGTARLLPGEALQRALPERAVRQQRFAKTVAELERNQAATRPDEPWGNVVPRPAVPQSNPVNGDSRWSRLWSRR